MKVTKMVQVVLLVYCSGQKRAASKEEHKIAILYEAGSDTTTGFQMLFKALVLAQEVLKQK